MRGGYRPNSGPAKGTVYRPRKSKPGQEAKSKPIPKPKEPKEPTEREKLKAMLAMGIKAKAKFYQDFLVRISHGEKLTVSEQKMMDKLGAELAEELGEKEPEAVEAEGEKLEPGKAGEDLEADAYLRMVWNDPNIEHTLRIRAAEIVFRGLWDKLGKKEEKSARAKAAGGGKFAPSAPPNLKVVKK